MQAIEFFNRYTQSIETESVYGENFLKWTYHNPFGKIALHSFVKRPFFSTWYGNRMNQPKSKQKILPFIEKYQLDAREFIKKPSEFSHFNDFFYRQLTPQSRPTASSAIVFPADGRHLGFQKASEISGVFVKGQSWNLTELLASQELAKKYKDGSLVLSRLCPVDYHRFHFPCEGTPSPTKEIQGPLFSVSPIALRKQLSYLWQNKRTITELKTPHLGSVLIIEIGATCVGSIKQSYRADQIVDKGQEKGYFQFGGSSTITIFEPNRIQLAQDLLEHSSKQRELYARVGDSMGETL